MMAKHFKDINHLREYMEKDDTQDKIRQNLPETVKGLSPARVARAVIAAATKNDKLLNCTQTSLVQAVVDAVQLGLEPGGQLEHAHMVPFGSECKLMIGYKGLLVLARRSGEVSDVETRVIHENDTYEVLFGSEPKITHAPHIPSPANNYGPAGEMVAVYCVATLKDKKTHIDMMTRAEVDKIRDGSRAKNSGPWKDHYEEMARKTVLRRAWKLLPQSTDLAAALAINDDTSVSIEDAMGEARAEALLEKTKTEELRQRLVGDEDDDGATFEPQTDIADVPEWGKSNE